MHMRLGRPTTVELILFLLALAVAAIAVAKLIGVLPW